MQMNHEPATTPEAVAALNRVELIAQAQAESKAVKAALKAGQPAPSTPALDYMNSSDYKAGASKASKSSKAKDVAPLVTRQGFTTIELVRGRQLDVVRPIASKVEGVELCEPRSLLVSTKGAQPMAEALVEYLAAESKPYPTRMGVLTLVSIRKAFPKVTTSSTSPVNRLVDALNADTESSWGFDVNDDSTLTFWMMRGDKREQGSVSRLLANVVPPKPKAEAKPRLMAASKPTTKPAAKKATAKPATKAAAKNVTPIPKKATAKRTTTRKVAAKK